MTKPPTPNPLATRMDQRREHQRTPLRMSAEVHVADRSFTATTRDLSEGGCGLTLNELLGEGTEVTLGLFLVIDDVEEERVPPLWVKGRVVWSADLDPPPPGDTAGDARASHTRTMAGIRFEVITEEQKVWVRHVLHHLAPVAVAR